MSQHLTPQKASHSSTEAFSTKAATYHTSQSALKFELAEKIIFNVVDLADKKIGAKLISSTHVAGCYNTIRATVEKNLNLIIEASKEDLTYRPWLEILQAIEEYQPEKPGSDEDRRFHRKFFKTATTPLIIDDNIFYAPPARKPDLCSVDIAPATKELAKKISRTGTTPGVMWRQVSFPSEIKLKNDDGPYSPGGSESKVLKQIVTETADFVRLHLAVRPFQIFSFALMLFGTHFCITYWDHGGALISPEYDVGNEKGLEMLIRIITRLTRDMTYIELGQDPTVQLTPNHNFWDSGYPEFTVAVPGTGQTDWTTVGEPIFTSTSLLGRATSVWHVKCLDPEANEPVHRILKSAWRHELRKTESDRYKEVGYPPPSGVARFMQGGDVKIGKGKDRDASISVNYLRRGVNNVALKARSDRLLHRLLLASFGQGIAKFHSSKEFVGAMHDAIQGHQRLYESQKKLLHRDISPGNVFIAASPKEDSRGFVADLEFMKSELDEQPIIIRTRSQTTRFAAPHGPEITGTAQFMAFQRLSALRQSTNPLASFDFVEHSVQHDLEAFAWVAIYSILCHNVRVLATAANLEQTDTLAVQKHRQAKAILHQIFGNTTLVDILAARAVFTLGGRMEILPYIEDPHLQDLANKLRVLISKQNRDDDEDPIPITYAALCGVFANSLASLPA